MNTISSEFDGPRLVRREEVFASDRLFRICFGLPEADNKEEIVANYVPPRRGGTYVIAHQGKLVSQLGIFHDRLKIYDGTIDVGSVGGVGTHPDYRKRGLASRLLEHCTEQLVKEGARLLLISGDEGVYMRLGNVFQGKYTYFSIQPGGGTQWKSTPSDLIARRATEADALICSQLYQAEPVHFVRKKLDFVRALQNPMSNTYTHADPWMIERSSQVVAYLFLGALWGTPLNAGIRHVGEYAGSRSALADALHLLTMSGDLHDLLWPVAWQDEELIHLLRKRGYAGQTSHLDGATHRIINFPGLMKDLRPVLQARLDAKLLRGLRFEQHGPLLGGLGDDRYAIVRGSDRLELDGAAMTHLLMGNADPQAESISAPGALAEVISAIFPLPSFLPGLNYH
ncbi:MAG TPA: GNAT family N-acetyltransferase [Anaerolineales bacterium]|nr:GNAT family N-acetyltransferase [Anaerolineales bacterium]